MKLISNAGNDRVIDHIQPNLDKDFQIGLASQAFSLFAFASLRKPLSQASDAKLILPADPAQMDTCPKARLCSAMGRALPSRLSWAHSP